MRIYYLTSTEPQKYGAAFNIHGLTFCRMNNTRYVTLWFADKSKIVDHGNEITAHGGSSVKDNAKRVCELAGPLNKGWTRISLAGSEAFVIEAMRCCAASVPPIEVVPTDNNQLKLWKRIQGERIQAEAKTATAQVVATTNPAQIVPSLAAQGKKLGARLASSAPVVPSAPSTPRVPSTRSGPSARTPKRGRSRGL